MLLLACLAAAAVLFFALDSRRRYLALPVLNPPEGETAEDHCVIIPARDEETSIETAVRSFAGSLTVVVDDHSSDKTAALAQAAGAEVRQTGPLPRKWTGKAHACWCGAQYTESKWILFADADVSCAPGFLPALLACAAAEELHAASVFPAEECNAWYEKAFLPFAQGLQFAGINAGKVNDDGSRAATASGRCFLFLRSAYNFIGTHAAASRWVAEDLALAGRLKRHRMHFKVMRSGGMARVRCGGSFARLWNELERRFHGIVQAGGAAGWWFAAATLAMAAWIPAMVQVCLYEDWILAAALAIVPVPAWRRWYGSWARSLYAPLACIMVPAMVCTGVFKSMCGIRSKWKGRKV